MSGRTRLLPWLASATSLATALLVLAAGIRYNSYAVADTDPYGYISEADLIAHGSLRVDQRFLRQVPIPAAERAFAPDGYRPASERGFIVPIYPPGYPLVMALFQRTMGRGAVFYVVPLLGALAVWMTGRLGTAVHGPLTGAIASLLVASSPAFLFQVVVPMSDVPAAAWWTTSLALAVREVPLASLAAGAAASMAVLTRPNLVLLAAVIGAFFLWLAARASRTARPRALANLTLFAAAVVPGCLAVAAINQRLYGSPVQSGYGDFGYLYAWSNLGPNLDRFPRWLLQTQTPFIFLGLSAPWVRSWGAEGRAPGWRRERGWLLLACVAVVFASYVFYRPFGRDEWPYLRFLLPAYPALIILSVVVATGIVRRIATRAVVAPLAILALGAALTMWQAHHAIVTRGAFYQSVVERRYVDVGRYIASFMPRNAIFIAGLHAGSIRYYSGRLTVRYDELWPRWLDTAVSIFREQGYRPYIVLEEDEEPKFRARFRGPNELAELDWPPAVHRSAVVRVRIYDPLDRPRFLSGEGVITADVDLVRKPTLSRKSP